MNIPESESDLLRLAADLLYERGDPRATPWPAAAVLERIRSRLRGIADSATDGHVRAPDGCHWPAAGPREAPGHGAAPLPAQTGQSGAGAKPVTRTERRASQ